MCIHRETMDSKGGGYLNHKKTPPCNSGCFWIIYEWWSQILLFCHGFEQSCSAMATKSWRKGYSNTTKMQNQAKLAVGAHQEHMAKLMSKFLHWSATAMPAASCAQLPFDGAFLLVGSKIAPPKIWGTNPKLFSWISPFYNPPSIISALKPIWETPPLHTHRFPIEISLCIYMYLYIDTYTHVYA